MRSLLALILSSPLLAAMAGPVAKIESFSQAADRTVSLTYSLSGDAIVTLSLEMKNELGEWTALDDSVIQYAYGDVNREVAATSGDAVRTIAWLPESARFDVTSASIRPVLTVWPKDDPPNYMVVDLALHSDSRVCYYATTNALPGGLLDNLDYRTVKLVLRKIPAKGVTWQMGSTANESGRNVGVGTGIDAEILHDVSFDSNYYMAVFETTQSQWFMIKGASGLGGSFTPPDSRLLLPLNAVSYCDVREGGNNAPNTAYEYPSAPHPDSFLGILRSRTGLQGFDLPSDAEWEYACRAGNGENLWGNGAQYSYSTKKFDPLVPGRYQFNQPDSSAMTPAPVGSYAPNDWGIYDMHGNVFEWCVDWYKHDLSGSNGEINTADGTSGTYKSVSAKHRNRRGGAYNLPVAWLRSACRTPEPGNSRGVQNGFRVKYGAAIAK
ncbi:MAG: formylglycine-generating enzyme family protein [Kiritimatiellae bacterium]|nr:formylglycine-generating enzyme family protein [Kiritimatiellia bacterium]MBR6585938.1 formylglycine-generating enzyme family protein [Kiritimatiellia bacterium]